jgi:hypothetical protein
LWIAQGTICLFIYTLLLIQTCTKSRLKFLLLLEILLIIDSAVNVWIHVWENYIRWGDKIDTNNEFNADTYP